MAQTVQRVVACILSASVMLVLVVVVVVVVVVAVVAVVLVVGCGGGSSRGSRCSSRPLGAGESFRIVASVRQTWPRAPRQIQDYPPWGRGGRRWVSGFSPGGSGLSAWRPEARWRAAVGFRIVRVAIRISPRGPQDCALGAQDCPSWRYIPTCVEVFPQRAWRFIPPWCGGCAELELAEGYLRVLCAPWRDMRWRLVTPQKRV